VKAPNLELEHWETAGVHCSTNERRADEASRDVEAWLKCRYMREHLGEEFGGTVSAVTSFGRFVTLDALYVEGLVHITELGGEYYRFDEVHQELRGERSGARYAVGTRVRAQVSRSTWTAGVSISAWYATEVGCRQRVRGARTHAVRGRNCSRCRKPMRRQGRATRNRARRRRRAAAPSRTHHASAR
jgi:ribonuclease R